MPNRLLYGGQQYDPEVGQYYLRARYYNPVVGRFTQEDPYRGDGLNLYAYCANNPVTYSDPSGYACSFNAQAEENAVRENATLQADEAGGTQGNIEGESETVTNNQGKEIDITPNRNHTTSNKNPGYKGDPNSSLDILEKDGNVVTRRWFDENGNAIRDVDMTNHGNPKQHPEWPHEHFWEYGPDGKPINRR